MLSRFFKKSKKSTEKKWKVKVDKSMRDFSKDEFFVKKAEAAEELFSKYGFPQEPSRSK